MTPERWREIDRIVGDALALPEPERLSFVRNACAGQPDLAKEAEALLSHDSRRGPLDLLETVSDLAARPGDRLDPYRLIREIGRGGMGTVWLAERDDAQFDRRVAIKLLTPGIAAIEGVRRFREERQILASLDHPHIARLIDAGRSPSGVHYLVMEYVDGVPITEFCAARTLRIRERVELLRRICSTIHFAHQRLVIHRDLKPANILVTGDGNPKLLDFGVAKMLNAYDPGGAATTSPMLRFFTPAYASPEQLGGGSVTIATDVYSLGLLAYELLTGVNPQLRHGRSLEEIQRAASEDVPMLPPSAAAAAQGDRAFAQEIAGDLDAILLKALRRSPDERYGSAEELAEDLDRYLSGLPVHARRGTLRYRAVKFVRRHRVAVVATSLALIVGVSSVTALLWQRREARVARAIAERRIEDVRQLAGRMIFTVDDQLATLPGSTAARQLLVSQATEYLGRLARDADEDPELAFELASAYLRVGEVQGNPSRSNLGDSAGALKSYESAQRIIEARLARDPSNLVGTRLLARTHLLMSELQLYLRKYDLALDAARNGLALREQVAGSTGSDADRREVANAYYHVADALQLTDPQTSLPMRQQALEVFESILRAQPEDDRAQRDVALAYKTIAATFEMLGRTDEQEAALERAFAVDEQRVAANPRSAEARLDLSFDTSQIATFRARRGDFRGALPYMQRTVEIRKALLEADPQDARVRGRLAFAYLRAGSLQLRLGSDSEALENLQAGVALADRMIAVNAGDRVAMAYRAEGLANMGYAHRNLVRRTSNAEERSAHHVEACRAFRHALEAYRRNEVTDAANPGERKDAAQVTRELAGCGTPSTSR